MFKETATICFIFLFGLVSAAHSTDATLKDLFDEKAHFIDYETVGIDNPTHYRVSLVTVGSEVWMYYRDNYSETYGYDSPGRCVSLAKSYDGGLTFTTTHPNIVGYNSTGWNKYAYDMDVIKVNDIFYMAFEGVEHRGGGYIQGGFAYSEDGENWISCENPSIVAYGEEWFKWVSTPNLIYNSNNDRFYYFFNGFNVTDYYSKGFGVFEGSPVDNTISLFESNPVVVGNEGDWDQNTIAAGRIVEEEGEFFMVYEGALVTGGCGDHNPWGIGLAKSHDLINWEKFSRNPIRVGPPTSGCDTGSYSYPTIVKIDGVWYLYYNHRSQFGNIQWGRTKREKLVLKGPENNNRNVISWRDINNHMRLATISDFGANWLHHSPVFASNVTEIGGIDINENGRGVISWRDINNRMRLATISDFGANWLHRSPVFASNVAEIGGIDINENGWGVISWRDINNHMRLATVSGFGANWLHRSPVFASNVAEIGGIAINKNGRGVISWRDINNHMRLATISGFGANWLHRSPVFASNVAEISGIAINENGRGVISWRDINNHMRLATVSGFGANWLHRSPEFASDVAEIGGIDINENGRGVISWRDTNNIIHISRISNFGADWFHSNDDMLDISLNVAEITNIALTSDGDCVIFWRTASHMYIATIKEFGNRLQRYEFFTSNVIDIGDTTVNRAN